MRYQRTTPVAIAHTGFASLANASARAFAKIANPKGYPAIEVQAWFKTGATVDTTAGALVLYLLGSLTGENTDWSLGYTGTEGAVSVASQPNPRWFASFDAKVAATAFVTEPVSVIMGNCKKDLLAPPPHWTIALSNLSGGAISATEADLVVKYSYLWPVG